MNKQLGAIEINVSASVFIVVLSAVWAQSFFEF